MKQLAQICSQSDWTPACIERLESQAKKHDVEFQCGHMRWRQFGNGRPLVLLHGGHGSWMHWIRNIEALAEHFAVWVPDLPGYGESDVPCQTSLASLVETTALALDRVVGAESEIALVGFSFGGLVAAHVAAKRKRVRKLALLGPAGHGTQRRPVGRPMPWKGTDDELDLAARMKHNLAVQMLHAPENIDSLAVSIHTNSCIRTRFNSKVFSRGNSLSEALDRHAEELLLVWGENDVTADPAVLSQSLTTGHPRRQAHAIKASGHWVQYECPMEINRLLLGWLNAPSASARPDELLHVSGEH